MFLPQELELTEFIQIGHICSLNSLLHQQAKIMLLSLQEIKETESLTILILSTMLLTLTKVEMNAHAMIFKPKILDMD